MPPSTSLPLRPLALAITLVYGGLLHSSAGFADAPRQYAIAPGALTVQLAQFAEQAGIILVGNAALTDGRDGQGLSGDYDTDAGLAELLRGHGLAVRRQADGSYVLEALSASGLELSPMHIEASNRSTSYQPSTTTSILRSDASPLEVPQVVNVVPAQVLRDQRPRNLDDALGNVSGITQGNTLASTQDTIMKRGFGGNRDGSIMRNGMPLVQGRGFGATADSVEVLKGPASLLYGIMDPGGVINVVSKRPELQAYNAISARASGYAHGRNGGGGTLDSTGALGDNGLAYRLVLDYEDEDYWRNFGTRREKLVAPSLAWYGETTQVVLSYEYREYLTPFDRGTALDPRTDRPLDIPRTRRLDEPFNEMEGRSELTQLTLDHQFNDNWKGHFGYSWNRETYDANQLRINGINADTGAVARSNDATHGAVSSDSYAIARLQGSFRLLGLQNDLLLGIDDEKRKIYREDLLREAVTAGFNYLNPVYGLQRPSSTVSASDSDQTDKLRNNSVFVQDALYLGERWILVAGARFQTYDQIAGRGRPFRANTNTSGQELLPRLGLVYRWNDELSFYGSYTESLKPTSSIAPLSSGVVIDSSVLPEQAKSYELGAKLEIPGRITGTLAFFDIDKKNVLVSQYNTATNLTDWHTSGAARSRGIELDVSGELNERWSLIGSLALLDAKTTDDPLYQGNRLWNVARRTASLSAVYDAGPLLGGDRLRLGGGARHVGERPGDSANSFELPSYTVADAFLSYDTKIDEHNLRVQLNVKNLFDRTYYTSSANRYFVSMGDSRQFILSTTLEF
ncbi:TonB-dependent receptor [Ectopseudomonas hydrolytica]|uniref:TonB-dependent receptor n=1 Tax=Ectopseudomonas hydrolytica TaxID=2493633 RepID=A0ABY5A179_9GAMM|nr:TonB-dependent receptor [Pseudomonas hydrolytica]USR37659.1 TonB-dependent receptor [Pseudomonas hydrolytica]